MLKKYKADDGTLANPGYAWENDPDTGRRLAGVGDQRDVVGGADVLKVASDHVDAMLGLKVGSGAEVAKILSGTASFTGVVNSGAVSTAISVTVTGAAPGNKNLVIGSIDLPAGGYGSGYEQVVVEGVVSAADTVKLFVRNSSGQNVSWTGATVRALVIQMA